MIEAVVLPVLLATLDAVLGRTGLAPSSVDAIDALLLRLPLVSDIDISLRQKQDSGAGVTGRNQSVPVRVSHVMTSC